MKFLTSGKVKDIYELEDNKLLFKFTNRVSAYDVKFKDEIPKKGEVLCKFAEYWFNKLDVPNHFVDRRSDTEIVVKKIHMLPIECVVRGYFYGSLVSRWKDGKISLEDGTQTDLAAKLPSPIFDPTTKSTHDMPVNKEEAISQELVTPVDYDWLSRKSIKIYGDNHYSVVTQDLSNDEVFPHSGLYKVDGDSYTELFKIHHNPNMIEKSETFKYRLDNNQLIISSDYMQETWVRLE